jgi:hypothetical protein
MDITKKLADLEVKITRGANKRPPPTEEITNIWCNNCKGPPYNPRTQNYKTPMPNQYVVCF